MGIISIISLILFFIFYFKSKKDNKAINDVQNIDKKYNKIINAQKNNKKENKFLTPLNFGVSLVILSSIIFATSTWNLVSGNLKVLILMMETILFLILGLLLKYHLKITKSGSMLIFIGYVLLFITFLSAGYFRLFGQSFSLFGKYSNLYLSIIFLMEFLILFIRKRLIKSNNYIISFICCFFSFFFLVNQLSQDVIFTFSAISMLLLIINLYKESFFENSKHFNIFNMIFIMLLTFIYFSFCISSSVIINYLSLNKIPLFILLITLCVNVFVTINKKDSKQIILSILYSLVLTFWYGCFYGSLLIFSYIIFILGIIMFLTCYFLKNNMLKKVALSSSFILGLVSMIAICFDKTFVILAPFMAFVYLVLTFVLEKNILSIFNKVFQLIYSSFFLISILIQPSILNHLKAIDVILIINVFMLVMLFIKSVGKDKLVNIYLIIIILLTIIQSICSNYYNNLFYCITPLIVNLILIIFSYFSKDNFNKKAFLPISITFILNLVVCLDNYNYICIILSLISLLIFYILSKNDKKKYVYESLLYVPLFLIISILPISSVLKHDLRSILLIPFIIIFSRKYISLNNKIIIDILEFIIASIIALQINNNLVKVIFIIMIYVISYLLSFKDKKSSKYYLNYLLFLTPIMFNFFSFSKYYILYHIILLLISIANNIIYCLLFDKRNFKLEVVHLFLSFILINKLISELSFGNVLSGVISFTFLLILYFSYDSSKMRYFVICLVIYPLTFLINCIKVYQVNEILSTFIWIIPIIILLRKILKVQDNFSNIVETTILSFMFLTYVFQINIYVALTLGIISVILILLGLKFKNKLFSYVGYISLIIIVIIQTISLWKNIPWWFYLLSIGVILIFISVVNESRKR